VERTLRGFCFLGQHQRKSFSGEEEIIIEAFKRIKSGNDRLSRARLVIAPRRPERFSDVEQTIKKSLMSYVCRSTAESSANARRADVILLDSLGELAALYRFAKVVVLGGSLLLKLL
jgi:3-deoxy-D-manno-octulosonic-acid transferase